MHEKPPSTAVGQALTLAAMSSSLSGRKIGHVFGDTVALDDLEFSVEDGQILAVVGPSGCGKSTLLELICGLQEPTSGSIEVGGLSSASDRLDGCAYMPQTDCLLPWYPAIDNASLALRNKGFSKAEARRSAGELFDRLGLSGFEKARPDELSGGMRQRVAFLRTLLSGKGILLLDEPFAALDAITRAEVQEWLLGVQKNERRTIVLVTHDVEEALYLGDRVAIMSPRPGRIVQTIDSPEETESGRLAAVTTAGFTERRQRVMSLLGAGGLSPRGAG